MSTTDSYAVLLERIGFPGSPRLRPILESLMTPDVARMVEALPATVAEVAENTGFDAGRVREELDSLFLKGVVFPRGDYSQREYFRFARSITQLHDASQASRDLDVVKDREYYELWQDFVMNEMYPRTAQNLKANFDAGNIARSRVVPAYLSIKDLPEILPYENYREMVKAQSRIAVVPCSCRYRTTAVDEHCDHTSEETQWNCLQFNRSADYNMARGAGRELTVDEAIALIDKMEEDGILHMWQNSSLVAGVNTSCNCCRDCCMNTVPLDQVGLPLDLAWGKSRYAAYVAAIETCDGCQDCIDRCQFDAIEMAKVAGAKRMKAVVEEDKCFGCGVCVIGCKPASLKMKVIRPPEFIPVGGAVGH